LVFIFNMDKKLEVSEGLLKYILDKESRKVVGELMKRFEIHKDTSEIKKAVKELIYESYRHLFDIIGYSSKTDSAIYLTKSEGENGRE